MNLATGPGALAVSGLSNLFNGGTLSLYSGSIPATPETTATGTLLYTFLWATPAFGSLSTTGGFDSFTATFSGSGTFVAAGTVGYARATMATPTARVNSTAYTRGNLITASGNLYVCIAPGTTSGTSTLTTTGYGLVDGSASFDYVGVSTLTAIADYTTGTSGTDIVLGSTTITSGITTTITSFMNRVATL